jgi:hypothetical protein
LGVSDISATKFLISWTILTNKIGYSIRIILGVPENGELILTLNSRGELRAEGIVCQNRHYLADASHILNKSSCAVGAAAEGSQQLPVFPTDGAILTFESVHLMSDTVGCVVSNCPNSTKVAAHSSHANLSDEEFHPRFYLRSYQR